LASVIAKYAETNIMQGVFWGVGIGVMILLISATREIWSKAVVDKFTLGLFAILLVGMIYWQFSPVIVVLIGAFSGILYNLFLRKREKQ